MRRILLRLLLIVSLVMNGVAAPWAVAKVRSDAAVAESGHRAMSDCHRNDAAEAVADAVQGEASERSCCGSSGCDCGCLLPPMSPRLSVALPAVAWSAAPASVPPTRAMLQRVAAPFRPPAV